MKTKTYKITSKAYYYEFSDWSSEYVQAISRQEAIKRFVRRHKIRDADFSDLSTLAWSEGDWQMQVRLVQQVAGKPKVCPHCGGSGEIPAVPKKKK